jgi:hypothetical protein
LVTSVDRSLFSEHTTSRFFFSAKHAIATLLLCV